MATDTGPVHRTRMLFLGDDTLADGFKLIGFETFPNPAPDEVDRIFKELLRGGENAFVVVDGQIMESDVPGLRQVRQEGGRVVVAAVPALNAPPHLPSEVADRLQAMFGSVQGDTSRQ